MAYERRSPAERWLENIEKQNHAPGGCWDWQAHLKSNGYGYLQHERRAHLAHRLTYWLATGELPEVVMHRCDRKICVNPDHLEAGTPAENSLQAVARGLMPRGERSRSRLTEKQVREIRAARNMLMPSRWLACEYGVSKSTILRIGRGDVWAHV